MATIYLPPSTLFLTIASDGINMNSGADPGGGGGPVVWVANHPSLYVEKQTEIRGSHKNLVKPNQSSSSLYRHVLGQT